MNKKTMKKYADLIIQEGINVQPGQDVCVFTSVENTEIARYVAKAAYQAKARKVFVKYNDSELLKMKVKYQKQQDLNTFEDFEVETLKYYGEQVPCFVHIVDEDPDALKGMNMKKYNEMRQALYPTSDDSTSPEC